MSYQVRKRKVIKPGLQFRLIGAFLTMAVVAACFQVVLINRSLLRLAREMGDEGEVLLSTLPQVLVGNVTITLLVLLPFMLVFGALVTHRIAGPVYRFETHLGAIARGEAHGICKIRRGDELHELCDRINEAVGTLEGRIEAAHAEIARATAVPEETVEEDSTEVRVLAA